MPHWLIDEGAANQLREAYRVQLRPTDAQLKALEERDRVSAADGSLPYIMSTENSTAIVRVEGVLTKKPDLIAILFGGGNTTYRAILSSLAIAQNDPAIKSVVLAIDSPGGDVDGLFDTMAALENLRATKKITVQARNALSAAYGIAAAAGRIEATGPGSRFGSVGVVASFRFWADEETVDVTNSDSPDKRPNPKTEEGKAVIQRELDAIHSLFVDAIAAGRGTTAKSVREDFGRGATMLASEARKRGMIDTVARTLRAASSIAAEATERMEASDAARVVTGERYAQHTQRQAQSIAAPVEAPPVATGAGATTSLETQKEPRRMDLNELKKNHPDIYQAAVQDGVSQGVKQERDRVSAHLEYGKAGGEEGLKIAYDAIEKGTEHSQLSNAKYFNLALNARDRSLRASEEQAVAGAANAPGAVQGANGSNQAASAVGTEQPQTEEEKREALGHAVADRILAMGGRSVHAVERQTAEI